MNLLKIGIFALALSLTLPACIKKEAEPAAPIVYQEENFLQGFLIDGGFGAPSTVSNALQEFGFGFTPRVKGKINAVVVKLPVAGSVGVRIWDLTTGSRVGEEVFNVPTANIDFVKNITALALNKDKPYAITMYAENYYKYQRSSTVYPIKVGNITISGYDRTGSGTASSLSGFAGGFGSNFIGSEINGNVSFKFQQTE